MRYTFLLLFLISSYICYAQGKVSNRIVMIGNFSDAADKKGFIEAVRKQVALNDQTIVLFLGNTSGSPVDTTTLRLAASVIDNTAAKAIFVPGYEEWNKGREFGYRSVVQQQKFLESLGNKRIKVYPGDGCPGPKNVDLKDKAELYIMDSQWWLHEHGRPDIESDCKYRTKEDILAEIEDIPKDQFDKLILFVTHHPMMNTGVHSGNFSIKQHIFPFTDLRSMQSFYLPLPLIGSLYPITRNAVTTKQDIPNVTYQEMAQSGVGSLYGFQKAFDQHPNVIFISGQEHSMQLLQDGRHYQVISGAAGGGGRVMNTRHTDFVSSAAGFSVLETTDDKKVSIQFYKVDAEKTTEAYKAKLLDYSSLPPLAKDTARRPYVQDDSVVAAVNKKMNRTSAMQRLLIGQNYREEWAADVKMKVFHINKEKGGLKITGVGGGHESKSLQMEDANGKSWVLRSINKDLSPVTPEGFRQTIASSIVQDLLSGVHPYGALVVPDLLTPLNVTHATPEVVFVPNDPALGEYRAIFANTVCQLEERKPVADEKKVEKTSVTINNMVTKNDHLSDQMAYLKSRWVDFLVSDFDRHHNQLSWEIKDTAGREMYSPIPKDRDQALYHNQGLIMKFGRKNAYAFMTNFRSDIKKIRRSGMVGVYVDMYFTNALTAPDWQASLYEFRNALTDSVIATAMHNLPPEIYAIRGKELEGYMQKRRNAIVDKGMDYYRFMSKRVNVLGGNEADIFKVSQSGKNVLVQVIAKEDNSIRYSRQFDPNVTKEVRLFGFNGDDYFDIDKEVNTGIKFRIVGGKGTDTFDINGAAKNSIYDLSYEDNEVLARRRTTKYFSNNPDVVAYSLREEVHSSFRFPRLTAGFNPDDGVLIGAAATFSTHGFRKAPYASRQRLSALVAINRKAYQLKYSGEFNHLIRNYDLLVRADLYNPALTNFFGLGNETKLNPSKDWDFYRTRYDYLNGDVMLRKRFLNDSIMSFSIGPGFYSYWYAPGPNENRILENPAAAGIDPASVYDTKHYAGGRAVFTINNIPDEMVPERGIKWITEFVAQRPLNNSAKPYTRLLSMLDLYAELSSSRRLLGALHFGGGHIFSENFEYFQALTLGSNNYLRGYRRNRFAGSSMAYGSAELRYKLFNFNTYLLKGDFGLVGFGDMGRVWMKGEDSDKWHRSYGGGIYVIPYNYMMVSAVLGVSEEDKMFNVSVGTSINLVY